MELREGLDKNIVNIPGCNGSNGGQGILTFMSSPCRLFTFCKNRHIGVLSGSGCSQSFLGITSGRMMISLISSSNMSSTFEFVLVSVLRTSVATSVIPVTPVTSVLTSISTSAESIMAVGPVAGDDKADTGNSAATDMFW